MSNQKKPEPYVHMLWEKEALELVERVQKQRNINAQLMQELAKNDYIKFNSLVQAGFSEAQAIELMAAEKSRP